MILQDWSDEHTAKFRKAMFKVKHNLSETGLFTDEALAELLDKHPRNFLDVCTLGDHPIFDSKFRTGDADGVDGKTLIKAVKSGSIWMNLRKAMNMHPEYKAVLDNMYGELESISGRKAISPKGGILISSTTAKVPYHFDATETILWHVRGHKQMILYPQLPEFLADEDYETLMYSRHEDYLPYNSEMDASATIFDLHDDEMMTWPLNAPHRVVNKSYCVSITTEYTTAESTLKNSVMYTNAVLRHKFGRNPSWQNAGKKEKYVKAFAGKIMRKLGVLEHMEPEDLVSFKLRPDVPGFIEDVTPYQRTF